MRRFNWVLLAQFEVVAASAGLKIDAAHTQKERKTRAAGDTDTHTERVGIEDTNWLGQTPDADANPIGMPRSQMGRSNNGAMRCR